MRLEIPTFTRCCCCLPLRRGIIVLGYLSLAIAILSTWIEFQVEQSWTEPAGALYRGVDFFTQKWLPVTLYVIEIGFILILVFGAHMKRPGLLQMYYYYGITTTAAAFAIFLISLLNGDSHFYRYSHYYFYMVDLCTVFIGMVTQVYLLLLIRSELQKHKPRASQHYVNPLEEVCLQQPASNGLSLL